MGSAAELDNAEPALATLMAFQPVYARNFDLRAFELVAEDPSAITQSLADIQSFSQLIVEHYTHVLQRGKTVTVPCLLRLNAEILALPELAELPRDHFIFEVSPELELTAELQTRLTALAERGHCLALSYSADNAESAKQLLGMVQMLRIDVGSASKTDIEGLLTQLDARGLDLLAMNLQGPEQFHHCLDAGFNYFHGDFFERPQPTGGKLTGSNKVLLLQILAELEDPNTTIDKLERLILQDANLTYKFIKVVNSAGQGMSREIDTLSHALAILGTRQIRSWISMFLLDGHDDRPNELVRSMLVRGRMCEIIAEIANLDHPIRYFIVGLLSKLDLLTGVAMSDLMASVPLKQEIKDAILDGRGDLGAVLREVENYQDGRFDQLQVLSTPAFYETAYRHSTAWAQQLQSALHQ